MRSRLGRHGYFAGVELDSKPPLILDRRSGIEIPFRDGHPLKYAVARNSHHAHWTD